MKREHAHTRMLGFLCLAVIPFLIAAVQYGPTGGVITSTPTWTPKGGGPTATPTSTPGSPTNTPTATPTGAGATSTPTATPKGGGPTATPTSTPGAPTNTPTVTPTPGAVTSTGFLGPGANAAETTKAGDNNGYEDSPANAYVADGLFAIDGNSGSGTNTSCTSTEKDKHRYYNYNFNIPTFTALNGIEVRLTGAAEVTVSSPKLCIQLSWNGGGSWTAAQSVPITAGYASYILGSPADEWGHTWGLDHLSNGAFRVRVIDVDGSTSNWFYLDAVAVNVTYQP